MSISSQKVHIYHPFELGWRGYSLNVCKALNGLRELREKNGGRINCRSEGLAPSTDLTSKEKVSFYAGRVLNFTYVSHMAVADIALQFIQSVSTTFELLSARIETDDLDKSKIYQFLSTKFSITKVCIDVRNSFTYGAFSRVAEILHIIPEGEKHHSFSSIWREFVKHRLFEEKKMRFCDITPEMHEQWIQEAQEKAKSVNPPQD